MWGVLADAIGRLHPKLWKMLHHSFAIDDSQRLERLLSVTNAGAGRSSAALAQQAFSALSFAEPNLSINQQPSCPSDRQDFSVRAKQCTVCK
jgi:hypothetical protein